jgi:hypothetical protein
MMPAANLSQIKNFSVLWISRGSMAYRDGASFEIKSYEHNGLKVSYNTLGSYSGVWAESVTKAMRSMLYEIGRSNKYWQLVQLEADFHTFQMSNYYKAMFPQIE